MTGIFEPTISSNTIWFDDNMDDCLTSHIEGIEGDVAALETSKANLVHTHSTYADLDHEHTEYALTTHTHSGYATEEHVHTGYADIDHTHTGFAPTAHSHSQYALASDVTALQTKVGDTAVSEQISIAVASKANSAHTHAISDVIGLSDELDSKYEKPSTGITKSDLASAVQTSLSKADTAIQSLSGYATESYVNAKVAGLVDSAPETLNTLNELSAALGDNPNFATTVATQIGGKVDKVNGKELSSNDYTDAEKIKLAGIANGANAYTLPTASSSTLGGVKTTSTVTSNSGYTACPIISGVPYYKDTNTTYSLSSFGVTATATDLNYVDGVTSNIQTQLNGKAESNHGTHVSFTATIPKAAGTAAVGSATTVSRSDHVHPEQTTVSGNAGSATKLATARTIRTNLGSTSTASFNGTANITPGVTGTLPVANGGTGQTKAWTNGTVSSLNSTTVTSAQFAIFPYLNKAFIRLNILTGSAIAADGAAFVALPSTIPTAHTALACYNEIGYDIHCGVSSNAGKGVYIINCGTSSMPSGTRLYISGWYSI